MPVERGVFKFDKIVLIDAASTYHQHNDRKDKQTDQYMECVYPGHNKIEAVKQDLPLCKAVKICASRIYPVTQFFTPLDIFYYEKKCAQQCCDAETYQ